MDERHDPISQLRHDRDRFVGFAFAAADALLEVDANHVIRYAGGAITFLTGRTPQAILGTSCIDLVAVPDRAMAKALLGGAVRRKRFGPVHLQLARAANGPVRVALFGACLPARDGCVYLALRTTRAVAGRPTDGVGSRDPVSGLLDRKSLEQRVLDAAGNAGAGANAPKMTLLSLDGLDNVKRQLDPDAADDLMAEIGAQLQASSFDGESAGRLDYEKFGLVHSPDLEVAAVEAMIAACARRVDPSGCGVRVDSLTMTLEATSLSEADRGKALIYTLNKFSESRQDFSIGELSEGYRLMLDDTRARMVAFKQTICRGEVDVVFQPIVELKGRTLHHYEALARFNRTPFKESTAQLIAFAEEVGLIGELDLLMCRQVSEKIQQARANGDHLAIAVNLSARSLESPLFVEDLLKLLAECGPIHDQLTFELTESWHIADLQATANIVHRLRERGFHICLDDFGAGASAFHYLRALEVDYVKIDGIYVSEAFTKPNGKTLLRSISSLCRDLKIQTVGEMIESEEVAAFLIDAGVTFGQGHLFGRPMPGLRSGGNIEGGQPMAPPPATAASAARATKSVPVRRLIGQNHTRRV